MTKRFSIQHWLPTDLQRVFIVATPVRVEPLDPYATNSTFSGYNTTVDLVINTCVKSKPETAKKVTCFGCVCLVQQTGPLFLPTAVAVTFTDIYIMNDHG